MTPTLITTPHCSGKLNAVADSLSKWADEVLEGRRVEPSVTALRLMAVAVRSAAIQPDPEPQPVATVICKGCGKDFRLGDAHDCHGPFATPSSAGTVSVEAAARVLLDGFERAQIDSSIIKLFQNGQHITALRALAGEGGR